MNNQIKTLIQNISSVIAGKPLEVELIVTALIAGGHVLLEDIPGVGKTQLALALSGSCATTCAAPVASDAPNATVRLSAARMGDSFPRSAVENVTDRSGSASDSAGDCTVWESFKRIQMTPDVTPADLLGYTFLHPQTGETEFRHGAVMTHFLLADELNRAAPRVQSALLEAMEEGQISIEGKVFALPRPFMTLATQNPIEAVGTNPLPEAQLDRFLMRLALGLPSREAERVILQGGVNPAKDVNPVCTVADVLSWQTQAAAVTVHPDLLDFMLDIADVTRQSDLILLGISPRGLLSWQRAAKAHAMMHDRTYVTPDDLLELAVPCLAHRLILGAKAGANTQENVLSALLKTVPLPNQG